MISPPLNFNILLVSPLFLRPYLDRSENRQSFVKSQTLELSLSVTSQIYTVLNIHWKDWCWSWSWPPNAKNWLIGKDSDAGKDWRQEEKGMIEGEMVGWHHWLNGLEFVWVISESWWWTGKPGVLQSMGSQRVRHDWVTDWTVTSQGLATLFRVASPAPLPTPGYHWFRWNRLFSPASHLIYAWCHQYSWSCCHLKSILKKQNLLYFLIISSFL